MITSMKLLAGIPLTAFFVATSVPVLPTAQAQENAETIKYRINIAGRQRMLTQRMAKAMCFFENGIEPDVQFEKMREAHDLFVSSLAELYEGGGQHNLAPEGSRRIKESLEKVMEDWEVIGHAVEVELESHHIEPEASEVVHEMNLKILGDMDDAVQQIVQEYANPNEVRMSGALAANLMGRQRMLIQKAAKEYCYIVTGYEAESYREQLRVTRDLFQNTLQALINGMPGMGIEPPQAEVLEQLKVVDGIWQTFHEDLTHAIDGTELPTDEIKFIAAESDHLLAEMNAAVTLYESQ